jgi:hypothetical protein
MSSRLDIPNPPSGELDFDWLILPPYTGLQTIKNGDAIADRYL